MNCAQCGVVLRQDAAFCQVCGAPVQVAETAAYCHKCGKALVTGASFGAACGTSVGAPPEPTPHARRPRRWLIPAVIALGVVLVLGAGTATALAVKADNAKKAAAVAAAEQAKKQAAEDEAQRALEAKKIVQAQENRAAAADRAREYVRSMLAKLDACQAEVARGPRPSVLLSKSRTALSAARMFDGSIYGYGTGPPGFASRALNAATNYNLAAQYYGYAAKASDQGTKRANRAEAVKCAKKAKAQLKLAREAAAQ